LTAGRLVPLGDLLCLLTPSDWQTHARRRRSMKRTMIVLGPPSTGERQRRQAEVQPAVYVVARSPAHAACFVSHSSDDVGQCKRLKYAD
jgi:hypothetical protein